jgi:hypothetical protein
MIAVVSLRLLYPIYQQDARTAPADRPPAPTKNVELLLLRHEVAVLRRTTPSLHTFRRWSSRSAGWAGGRI